MAANSGQKKGHLHVHFGTRADAFQAARMELPSHAGLARFSVRFNSICACCGISLQSAARTEGKSTARPYARVYSIEKTNANSKFGDFQML
jgi:hypothetical protein